MTTVVMTSTHLLTDFYVEGAMGNVAGHFTKVAQLTTETGEYVSGFVGTIATYHHQEDFEKVIEWMNTPPKERTSLAGELKSIGDWYISEKIDGHITRHIIHTKIDDTLEHHTLYDDRPIGAGSGYRIACAALSVGLSLEDTSSLLHRFDPFTSKKVSIIKL